jgi:orotidine-5'-phosphate decarboxylase
VAAENAGATPFGSTGLVIGATVGDALAELGIDLAASAAPILAPGLGAQGATGADMKASFGAFWPQVLGTSSRDVLTAGPDADALPGAAAAFARDAAAFGAITSNALTTREQEHWELFHAADG